MRLWNSHVMIGDEDKVRSLPGPLRWYLWAINGACLAMIAAAILALPALPHPLDIVAPAIIFGALAFGGEHVKLRINRDLAQGLASTAYVASILLFPTPVVVLLTLGSLTAAQVLGRDRTQKLYKRAFNVAHTVLAVGLTSWLLTCVTAPLDIIRPAHIATTWPLALAPVIVMYALEFGSLIGVFSLLERRPPWLIWWQHYRRATLPEIATGAVGIVVAVLWLYWPPLPLLLVAPVLGIRSALRAIGEAEERADMLRRRGAQMEAVVACGQQLRLSHTPADLLLRVAASAHAIANAGAVAAYAPDPDHPATLERLALYPAYDAMAGPTRLPHGDVPDRPYTETIGDEHIVSIPLCDDDGALVGLLRLRDVPRPPDDEDNHALTVLATQAAIALENARLHERALAQASEDGVTGLRNHRAFQTRLIEEVARAERGGQPLALMMIDLDGFGMVNNTYGHQIGDTTLAAVAQALQESVRVTDIAARYGGDEFVVILPETTLAEAARVAERVRAAIAGVTITYDGHYIHVSASCGIAGFPAHAATRDALIRAADDAAYAAKHTGGNRVSRPEDGALPRDPAVLAAQLEHANLATVEALAAAVDAKDQYTRGHSGRVSAYAVALATALGLAEEDVARIRLAGILHDVGKIGVPDAILTKPGKLDEDEFAVIKEHPVIGERMLAAVPFLTAILPAVRHHHERWDGRGYPDGLAGEAIPPDAAILALADAFDAMTSSRTYRPALPVDEAIRRVREGSGSQFAPRAVAAFERALADGTFILPPSKGAPHLTLLRPA